ncbi:hypothetical protein SDC9_70353 [bioreactor metagenome]|uniref:Uncharacterized protein n=1 Tax=bioreactor metagenome TaxID=1076179 RepID=A0A644Y5P6_9ZZZZ
MQQLPGIIIIKIVHKVGILCLLECLYGRYISGDMVESTSIRESGESMTMHLPVERWIFQGDQAHRFQPVRSCCLDVEASLDALLQDWEDGELVTA